MNSTPNVAITAIEPLPVGDWISPTAAAMAANGYSLHALHGRLAAWREVLTRHGVRYADGWRLSRLWLGPRRWALSVTPKRFYFDGDSIIHKPEFDIIGTDRPPGRSALEELLIQWTLMHQLAGQFGQGCRPVRLRDALVNIAPARTVCVGSERRVFCDGTLNSLYRSVGFDRVPVDWSISVCPLDGVPISVAEQFKNRLQSAASQRQARLAVRLSSAAEISDRAESLKATGTRARSGRCVLFVLPDRSSPPTPCSSQIFGQLDGLSIPYRRAYATDQLDFSIPDQLPSLLLAAGGRPHRVETTATGGPLWTLAIDLGHHPKRDHSVVVACLVDPDGNLVHAVRKLQPRDETANARTMVPLLSSCANRLAAFGGGALHLLVIRDGRMFENEEPQLYSSILGEHVSVIEYRKRWNPQVVIGGVPITSPPGEFAGLLQGESTMFVCTSRPRTKADLPDIAKVSWKPDWNRLQLNPADIARALASSAAAPGLGLHPRHWPAALYWADGIAGVSDLDLRFRGVPCEEV